MPSLSDRIIIKFFNAARKLHNACFQAYRLPQPVVNKNPEFANKTIRSLLCSEEPCMIGRFGSNEIETTVFARNRLHHKYDLLNYARGRSDIWWYPEHLKDKMFFNAGFFSESEEELDRFGEEMLRAMPLLDVLGSWCSEEGYFLDLLSGATFVDLELLSPFWGIATTPWTLALEGKKVLVVHPFAETIEAQYARRQCVHKDPRILPSFSLKTIRAVQSIAGQKPEGFATWFDALHHMENEIDNSDYDVCIAGCGAYGFLLAAHCKRMGKKAIHLGGATQLLFGIKGKRWENPDYGFNGVSYRSFMTPGWVRPSEKETPRKSADIEGGCYW